MSARFDVLAADLICLNAYQKDIRAYVGEAFDCGFDDSPEAIAKLQSLISVAHAWISLIQRRAGEDADRYAREEMETSMGSAMVGGN